MNPLLIANAIKGAVGAIAPTANDGKTNTGIGGSILSMGLGGSAGIPPEPIQLPDSNTGTNNGMYILGGFGLLILLLGFFIITKVD